MGDFGQPLLADVVRDIVVKELCTTWVSLDPSSFNVGLFLGDVQTLVRARVAMDLFEIANSWLHDSQEPFSESTRLHGLSRHAVVKDGNAAGTGSDVKDESSQKESSPKEVWKITPAEMMASLRVFIGDLQPHELISGAAAKCEMPCPQRLENAFAWNAITVDQVEEKFGEQNISGT